MKANSWYVKYPGSVYALGPCWFSEPKTEQEFREYLRKLDNINRLTNGTEVWPTQE